jgi:hypothetical protein
LEKKHSPFNGRQNFLKAVGVTASQNYLSGPEGLLAPAFFSYIDRCAILRAGCPRSIKEGKVMRCEDGLPATGF